MKHGPQATRLVGRVLHGPQHAQEMAVLDALRLHPWGLTSWELRDELGHMSNNSARLYADNLVEAGLAERSDKEGADNRARGRPVIKYRITDLGRQVF